MKAMKEAEQFSSSGQRSSFSADRTAAPFPAMTREQREALVTFWAEILTAEIRELLDVTVGSPSQSNRGSHV